MTSGWGWVSRPHRPCPSRPPGAPPRTPSGVLSGAGRVWLIARFPAPLRRGAGNRAIFAKPPGQGREQARAAPTLTAKPVDTASAAGCEAAAASRSHRVRRAAVRPGRRRLDLARAREGDRRGLGLVLARREQPHLTRRPDRGQGESDPGGRGLRGAVHADHRPLRLADRRQLGEQRRHMRVRPDAQHQHVEGRDRTVVLRARRPRPARPRTPPPPRPRSCRTARPTRAWHAPASDPAAPSRAAPPGPG